MKKNNVATKEQFDACFTLVFEGFDLEYSTTKSEVEESLKDMLKEVGIVENQPVPKMTFSTFNTLTDRLMSAFKPIMRTNLINHLADNGADNIDTDNINMSIDLCCMDAATTICHDIFCMELDEKDLVQQIHKFMPDLMEMVVLN